MVSLSRRVQAAWNAFLEPITPGSPFNWYEGGMPFQGGDKSWVPAIVQDARFDQNFVARRELMRKARYFAQNSPFIKRILEVDAAYTISDHVTPSSSDSEWNKRARDVWRDMSASAGLQGEDLGTLLRTAHPCERTDGEVFALKTRRQWMDSESTWRSKSGTRPCLQFVESHRVETPSGRWGNEGKSIIDGVEIAQTVLPDGRKTLSKVGYWIRSSFDMFEADESWDCIPPSGVMQIGEAQRTDQLRFISAFYAVINTYHNLDDLLLLEMAAAKDGAEKSTIIKTPSGEINAATLIKQRMSGISADPTTDDEWKKRVEYYQKTLGGRTAALKTGDEVTQYLNNRPTVTSREYWLFLLSVICAGLGVSILLVFPDFSDNKQGTAVRAELDIANQIFIRRGRKWRQIVANTWDYFMAWAIQNDRRVVDPPHDWRKVIVHPPRAVNVDVGRNSSAMLAELAAGATTYAQCYGPLGMDYAEQFDQIQIEQKAIADRGIKVVMPGQQQQPKPESEEDTPEPKGKDKVNA